MRQGKANVMQRMKEPHKKGVATHLDPESCTSAREGLGEALPGARAGRGLSLENCEHRSADVVVVNGRHYLGHRYRKVFGGSAWSETPSMYGSIRWNLGDLVVLRGQEESMEREGKSKDMSPQ